MSLTRVIQHHGAANHSASKVQAVSIIFASDEMCSGQNNVASGRQLSPVDRAIDVRGLVICPLSSDQL
jgi:hypothetical protein